MPTLTDKMRQILEDYAFYEVFEALEAVALEYNLNDTAEVLQGLANRHKHQF